jgi:hypothetical protein
MCRLRALPEVIVIRPELLLWAGWQWVDPICLVGDRMVYLRRQGFEPGVADHCFNQCAITPDIYFCLIHL